MAKIISLIITINFFTNIPEKYWNRLNNLFIREINLHILNSNFLNMKKFVIIYMFMLGLSYAKRWRVILGMIKILLQFFLRAESRVLLVKSWNRPECVARAQIVRISC